MDYYTIADHLQRSEIVAALVVTVVLLLIAVRISMTARGRDE